VSQERLECFPAFLSARRGESELAFGRMIPDDQSVVTRRSRDDWRVTVVFIQVAESQKIDR
jgi:hypothetical protein